MSTFITKLDTSGTGPRLAVKDLIDMEGLVTTAGCRAVERRAKPAAKDAALLGGARAADARIVGKVNLHELAMLPIGTNPWFGNPVNPLDPALIPGGSSSGSAVAVANDEADVALGSDTGGSIRVPSACCGTTGLKTTFGRIPLDGVWPLAPSLDTVGPMATTIGGLVLGMQLLEPGFAPASSAAVRIGRLRTTALPEIETAVDEALSAAELDVATLDWDGMEAGSNCFTLTYFKEIWDIDHELVEKHPDDVGDDIKMALSMTDMFRPAFGDIDAMTTAWRKDLFSLFDRVQLLALPTMPVFPPRLDELTEQNFVDKVIEITKHVSLFNAAGVPCTAQPVPVRGGRLPASIQLVGPLGSEELLLATAARIEAALDR